MGETGITALNFIYMLPVPFRYMILALQNKIVCQFDQNPGISLDKKFVSVTGNTVDRAGDIITYEFTVENTGNTTLTNVKLSDYFENNKVHGCAHVVLRR